MIYLDYSQNNSILNVFCHLLLEENRRKKQRESGVEVIKQTNCCQQQQPLTLYDVELENAAANCEYSIVTIIMYEQSDCFSDYRQA